MFAMAFGLFFIGYLTLKTRKSLWSVFAVLALLPASKSLVGVIMLARFRSLSQNTYDRYSKCAGSVPALYENILTTGERTFYVPMICYADRNLAAYAPDTSNSAKALKDHLDNVIANGGHSGITVKVYEDEEKFLERVANMSRRSDGDIPYPAVFNTIKAVSL